jgi:hypothetical protein
VIATPKDSFFVPPMILASLTALKRPHGEIRVAVAVDVRDARDRFPEMLVLRALRIVAVQSHVGVRVEPRPTEVDVGATGLAVVEPRAHHQIRVTVAVHVAGRAHGATEIGAGALADQREVRRGVHGRTTEVDVNAAGGAE